MIIFRCKGNTKVNDQKALQKRIVGMAKDGVIVVPSDLELIHVSEDDPEDERKFGFAQCIGFEVDDPELEEEE